MAHENDEDDEIEQHLIRRISHEIENQGARVEQTDPVIKEIKGVLDILRKKTNDNPKLVAKEWPSLRRENLYYLNNLFTEWQMTKNLAATSPIKSAPAGGQDINKSDENIKKNLKKMRKDLSGDHSEGSVTQRPRSIVLDDEEEEERRRHPIFERHKGDVYRWSSRYGPRKVHGLDHLVMAMERDLVMRNLDEPFKVFGITGVAGIGKTTLCQQIFNLESVRKHFCPRIWVCLSRQPKDRVEYKEEVVARILKCLGVEDKIIENAEKGTDGLKRLILLLRLQLTGRRYLLVLDDAWCDIKDDKFFSHLTQKEKMDENWGHELAYALPKGCGGTIICSSRSQNLLKRMLGKEASLTVMKRQTDAIIDEIFKDNVKGYDEDEREFPEDLTRLKKEILKKCDGIPLAATLLAKIAREGLPVKH
uniref:probable disease resistance protein At5g45490 n=1 Tax=Erigeron canadensis TaxID=72917 RepID=UPI001CB8DBCA|nr:probable disease resistance protein At5g45490 [Erigeron canadensis]